jgi:hypothetical protein
LLGRPGLFEEVREVFIEVDGATFAVPVGEHVVVTEKDHQFNLLLEGPVLVLEDGLLLTLPLAVLPLLLPLPLALLLHLRVALRAHRLPQRFLHLVRHN